MAFDRLIPSFIRSFIYLIIMQKFHPNHPPQYTVATLCDLLKAFDTINHGIVLNKLYRYVIRETVNNITDSKVMYHLQILIHYFPLPMKVNESN